MNDSDGLKEIVVLGKFTAIIVALYEPLWLTI